VAAPKGTIAVISVFEICWRIGIEIIVPLAAEKTTAVGLFKFSRVSVICVPAVAELGVIEDNTADP
jgi:hypothetical protein